MVLKRGKILERKTTFNLERLAPSGKQVTILYPELVKCQGCNTCTMSCPKDLNVTGYISSALHGEIAEVAELDPQPDVDAVVSKVIVAVVGLAPQAP